MNISTLARTLVNRFNFTPSKFDGDRATEIKRSHAKIAAHLVALGESAVTCDRSSVESQIDAAVSRAIADGTIYGKTKLIIPFAMTRQLDQSTVTYGIGANDSYQEIELEVHAHHVGDLIWLE